MRQEENPIQSALALLASMADSLAMIAAAMQNRPQQTDDEDKESLAIACLLTVGTNISAIARQVGVTRQRLYSMPRFRGHLETLKGSSGPGRVRRGSKHRESRTVEAWSDGDE